MAEGGEVGQRLAWFCVEGGFTISDENFGNCEMTSRRIKTFYFGLTALNTLGSTWFLNYLFFFLRDKFGFGNRENLWVSALHGFVYMFAAWQCGKFAQRKGLLAS